MISTGYHQASAGAGQHRQARAAAVRIGQQVNALPILPDPLHGAEVAAFVREYEMAEAAKPHTAARVVGGVVGYHLVRHVMNRRR